MITLKELEEKIPDKIIGVEMHNKNTVVYITKGMIRKRCDLRMVLMVEHYNINIGKLLISMI